MLRTVSPHAPADVSPAACSRSKTSGSDSSVMKCNCTFWRVLNSPEPRPWTLEIAPIARSCVGEVIPPGIFTRSMNVPIFGLSW